MFPIYGICHLPNKWPDEKEEEEEQQQQEDIIRVGEIGLKPYYSFRINWYILPRMGFIPLGGRDLPFFEFLLISSVESTEDTVAKN